MQNIPDLMMSMAELDDDSVQRVRKTAEVPPRVSVYDTIGALTGYPDDPSRGLFRRLLDSYPEVGASCTYFKFPGRGQRDTPVTNAEGITQIIMLLPGRAAAIARSSAANVMVRYLGGDGPTGSRTRLDTQGSVNTCPNAPRGGVNARTRQDASRGGKADA